MTAIRSSRVLGPAGFLAGDLVFHGDSIASIEPHGAIAGAEDVGDVVVAPGLIDLQINGAFGHDFTRDPRSIWDVAARLPEHGVTTFCPTVITAPPGSIPRAIEAVSSPPAGFVGADPIGLHLEGPLLVASRKGAHPEAHLLDAVDTSRWEPPAVRIVTVAPEVAGLELIADLRGRRVVVSIGHTDTDAAGAKAAFAAGASHVTHLFNAMPPLLHRDPGPVGASLANGDVTVSLIVDGVHVAPEVVAVVLAAVGSDRFVPITDAMAALGMQPGTHVLGEHEVVTDEVQARLADGTLAGSVLAMPDSVGNLASFADVDLATSLRCHASVPARVIGAHDRGTIEPGKRADVVLLDDDLTVLRTVVAGRTAYER